MENSICVLSVVEGQEYCRGNKFRSVFVPGLIIVHVTFLSFVFCFLSCHSPIRTGPGTFDPTASFVVQVGRPFPGHLRSITGVCSSIHAVASSEARTDLGMVGAQACIPGAGVVLCH